MKRLLLDLIFKLPLIFLMLMALMFVGVSSVMALSDTMIGNQIILKSQSMTMAPAESLSGHSLNLLNYKNMETSVSTLPEPTFHVGKIIFI